MSSARVSFNSNKYYQSLYDPYKWFLSLAYQILEACI